VTAVLSPDCCRIPNCLGVVKYRGKRLCMKHYLRIWKYGTVELPARPSLADRLTAQTERTDGCWLWTGSVGDHGYGHIGRVYVHRRAYKLAGGPLGPGQYVLHSCDVRNCVNPSHLSAGSHLDNIADARRAGRVANDPQTGRFLPLAGR